MFKRGKSNILKILLMILTVILVPVITSCMAMGPFGNTGQEEDQGITTFEVVKGDIVQEITTTGNVDSKTLNTYKAVVSGEIVSALEKGYIPFIFNRFYRKNSKSGNRGFGLGMSIIKKIVQNHKGEIDIEYDQDERRITFKVNLPA